MLFSSITNNQQAISNENVANTYTQYKMKGLKTFLIKKRYFTVGWFTICLHQEQLAVKYCDKHREKFNTKFL